MTNILPSQPLPPDAKTPGLRVVTKSWFVVVNAGRKQCKTTADPIRSGAITLSDNTNHLPAETGACPSPDSVFLHGLVQQRESSS